VFCRYSYGNVTVFGLNYPLAREMEIQSYASEDPRFYGVVALEV